LRPSLLAIHRVPSPPIPRYGFSFPRSPPPGMAGSLGVSFFPPPQVGCRQVSLSPEVLSPPLFPSSPILPLFFLVEEIISVGRTVFSCKWESHWAPEILRRHALLPFRCVFYYNVRFPPLFPGRYWVEPVLLTLSTQWSEGVTTRTFALSAIFGVPFPPFFPRGLRTVYPAQKGFETGASSSVFGLLPRPFDSFCSRRDCISSSAEKQIRVPDDARVLNPSLPSLPSSFSVLHFACFVAQVPIAVQVFEVFPPLTSML